MFNDDLYYISFAAYLIFMLLIGWHFYKKTKSLNDYVLGGRGLGAWVTSLSAQASDMSGWLLLGLPGYAFAAGLESSWIALGLAIGTFLNWKFIARKLRIYTEKAGDAITLPDYFENRFQDKSRILRMVSALFILVFFILYTASGFVAGAKLFSMVFGLDYFWALVIGICVIISYTLLGGFLAVSWTDFFQGIIMFAAIIIVPVTAYNVLNGASGTTEIITNLNPELLNMFTQVDGNAVTVMSVISLMAWGLGYFGQPHILARFMAIKDPGEVKKSTTIAMIWVVISLAAAIVIGMIGFAYLNSGSTAAGLGIDLASFDAERIFMIMISTMLHPAVGGICLAAILAAIMSTADSQLLVASSAFTEDFYRVFLRKEASQKELVWVSRGAVALIALIGFFIATDQNSSVLGLVSYAWAGFGATFGPIILFSLYWKKMTRLSAILSIVTGGITVIVWKLIEGGIFELYEIVPGFIIASLTIVIVSLVAPEKNEEIEKLFDEVHAE